jgi:hypothetical protein
MNIVLTESQKQFGKNVLLELIGLTSNSIPNYYQCYLANPNTIIVVTKNGGKKRICRDFFKNIETRLDELKVCGKHTCVGCFQTVILPKNKNYIKSEDNPNDPVYAITEFKVPQEYQKQLMEVGITALTQSFEQGSQIDFPTLLKKIQTKPIVANNRND